MSDADAANIANANPPVGRSVGYFAYAQSLDLNKIVGTASSGTPRGLVPGDVGGAMQMFTYNGSQYPIEDNTMPKVSSLPKPSATVYMFDAEFNPTTDLNGRDAAPQTYNSVPPAVRFKSFSSRHNYGAVIIFCDGHSSYFKSAYITNNMTPTMWTSDEESPLGDVVWDPAYRAWIGY
jgi:hypothetical protein